MNCLNFYSLGPHCCPRIRLDYIKNKNNLQITETNFFDYLMVDINCIKKIFSENIIENYLNIDNISIYHADSHLYIKIKNLELKSIHDVYSYNDYDTSDYNKLLENLEVQQNITENFIKKYIRRYERLINLLENDKNILFIYQNNILISDYIELNNIFKKYTNKKIVIVCLCDYGLEKKIIEKYEFLYYLNYNNMYYTKEYIYDPTMIFLNWDLIFENINLIYNENF